MTNTVEEQTLATLIQQEGITPEISIKRCMKYFSPDSIYKRNGHNAALDTFLSMQEILPTDQLKRALLDVIEDPLDRKKTYNNYVICDEPFCVEDGISYAALMYNRINSPQRSSSYFGAIVQCVTIDNNHKVYFIINETARHDSDQAPSIFDAAVIWEKNGEMYAWKKTFEAPRFEARAVAGSFLYDIKSKGQDYLRNITHKDIQHFFDRFKFQEADSSTE